MVEQEKLDNLMLDLDGTENKCKQGLGESRGGEGTHGADGELRGQHCGGLLRKDDLGLPWRSSG